MSLLNPPGSDPHFPGAIRSFDFFGTADAFVPWQIFRTGPIRRRRDLTHILAIIFGRTAQFSSGFPSNRRLFV